MRLGREPLAQGLDQPRLADARLAREQDDLALALAWPAPSGRAAAPAPARGRPAASRAAPRAGPRTGPRPRPAPSDAPGPHRLGEALEPRRSPRSAHSNRPPTSRRVASRDDHACRARPAPAAGRRGSGSRRPPPAPARRRCRSGRPPPPARSRCPTRAAERLAAGRRSPRPPLTSRARPAPPARRRPRAPRASRSRPARRRP